MSNPEDKVIDDIDELVDQQLEAGEQHNVSRCPGCGLDWHGIPRPGCKGGYELGDTGSSEPQRFSSNAIAMMLSTDVVLMNEVSRHEIDGHARQYVEQRTRRSTPAFGTPTGEIPW